LAKFLSDWDLNRILAADEAGEPSLAWLTITETTPSGGQPTARVTAPNQGNQANQTSQAGGLSLDDIGDDLTALAAAGQLGGSTIATGSWTGCFLHLPLRV